jgi:hypothetical protein
MSDQLSKALKKHGNATETVLAEPIEKWPIAETMPLLEMLVCELVHAEKDRRAAGQMTREQAADEAKPFARGELFLGSIPRT